jgi:3-hydroxyacyl-[acyl-carrier-protein] dehydratase
MTAKSGASGVVSGNALSFAAPLRAIDHVTLERFEGGFKLRAATLVCAGEPYLAGHFPGFAIFPGVFLLEALRQAVVFALGESQGRLPDISNVRSLRFVAPVLPGDLIELHATVEPVTASGPFEVDAECRRADGVTAARFKVEFQYGA